jgi:hypothetical protein
MSLLSFIDRYAAPAVTSLLLASLPLAVVGFFVPGL